MNLTPQLIKAIAAYPERFEVSFNGFAAKLTLDHCNNVEVMPEGRGPYYISLPEINEMPHRERAQNTKAKLKPAWQTMRFGGFAS